MWKEFKAFIMRGNVLDLAVAVVIGAAFAAIVNSFVTDILMPPIGLMLGKVDFANLFVNLGATHYNSLADAKKAGAPTWNYGLFLNTIINFLIVAFAIFLVVKWANHLKGPGPGPTTKPCPYCISTIPLAAVRCPNCTSDLRPA